MTYHPSKENAAAIVGRVSEELQSRASRMGDPAWRKADAAFREAADALMTPIPMILFCPECSLQHIDEPEFVPDPGGGDLGVAMEVAGKRATAWTNPPHRSHLCAGCGHIWRPADVPTTGVAEITTQGKADHQPPIRKRSGRCIGGCDGPVDMEP